MKDKKRKRDYKPILLTDPDGNSPQVIRVGHATLTKQEINQSRRTHTCVRVRICNDSVNQSNAQNFKDRILAETRTFAIAGPPDVGSDKQSSNQTLLK